MDKSSPNPQGPPRWADRLLSRLTPTELLEELQGDLHEQFAQRVDQVGPRRARWWYGLEALKVIRPYYLRRRLAKLTHWLKGSFPKRPATTRPFFTPEYPSPSLMNPNMIRNYLKIAWRNLTRHKSFSAINILGLVLGIASSLLILLWVQDERTIDRVHANGSRLYQVFENQQTTGNDLNTTPTTPHLLAPALVAELPEVERSVHMTPGTMLLLAVGTNSYRERGCYASPELFQIFSFPMVQGNPKTALIGPSSLVISEAVARKLFGRTDVVGRSVRVGNKDDRQVTGVFQDIPANSSLKFDFVLPSQPYINQNPQTTRWSMNGWRTFALLRPNTDVAALNVKMLDFIHRHNADLTMVTTFMFPFQDTYLQSKFTNGQPDGGRIEYVRLFTIVAVFLLLIACINFMNLATARSAKRAKEVGIRKVIGAERTYLIGQFTGEAVLLTLLSSLIALGLVQGLIPLFNQLTEKQMAIPYANPIFWAGLLGLAIITGLLAGLYPAFFLSSLQPVKVLKANSPTAFLRFKTGAVLLRQGLVVFQFALSLLLIIGTLIISQQMHFIRTKNLGIDRGNVLYMRVDGELLKHFEPFRQALLQAAGIQAVSSAAEDPLYTGNSTTGVSWRTKPQTDNTKFFVLPVSYDFVKTMNIRLLAGREFSKAFPADSTNYIINEEAARRMGMKNPIGQAFSLEDVPGTIIGVVKNFHLNSVRVAIEPLVMPLATTNTMLMVRTQPGQTEQALASLEQLTKQFNPAYPFTYTFADESFERLYKSETLVGKLTSYFALIAIGIACLGLFGLAMFVAEQRTKEIGVRKVMGASVGSIVALLSGEFMQLVGVAIVLASPLAWWGMHRWLRTFAYHVELAWWMFALAGGLVVGIALLTVSFQSIKAALANPVKSLRSE